MGKEKVIAIIGPTGSGKSSLAAFLASKLRGECISADSRQVYKGMRIISRAEPAYLANIADPQKAFSAGTFVRFGEKAIGSVARRGKVPIVVGGTGFYADALLRGLSLPEVQPNLALRTSLSKKTPTQLFAMLKKIDPRRAKTIDKHNGVRLIRAIEIAKALGKVPMFERNSTYDVLWLGVMPNEKTYEKLLKKGVEERLARGMAREVKLLRSRLSKKRFLELGFEFALLADYLDKKISKKELVEKMAAGEQKYAKRQMRWFKRNSDIRWVKNKSEALALAKQFCGR